jgi:hypothetical protein
MTFVINPDSPDELFNEINVMEFSSIFNFNDLVGFNESILTFGVLDFVSVSEHSRLFLSILQYMNISSNLFLRVSILEKLL